MGEEELVSVSKRVNLHIKNGRDFPMHLKKV